jgi:hypothetical protein
MSSEKKLWSHLNRRRIWAQEGIKDIFICFSFDIGSRKINLRLKSAVFEELRFFRRLSFRFIEAAAMNSGVFRGKVEATWIFWSVLWGLLLADLSW